MTQTDLRSKRMRVIQTWEKERNYLELSTLTRRRSVAHQLLFSIYLFHAIFSTSYFVAYVCRLNALPSCIHFQPSFYPPSPLLYPPFVSQLGDLQVATHSAMSEWRFSSASAGFSSLVDSPSINLTSLAACI